MADLKLDDERELRWRIFFKENDEGVDDKKFIIHTNRWHVYTDEKEVLIKGGYYM